MNNLESNKKRKCKGKNMEYVLKINYGTEKLQVCLQKLMKSMSNKENSYEEEV